MKLAEWKRKGLVDIFTKEPNTSPAKAAEVMGCCVKSARRVRTQMGLGPIRVQPKDIDQAQLERVAPLVWSGQISMKEAARQCQCTNTRLKRQLDILGQQEKTRRFSLPGYLLTLGWHQMAAGLEHYKQQQVTA